VTISHDVNQIATYPIALTKEVKNPVAARAFIAFVLSVKVKRSSRRTILFRSKGKPVRSCHTYAAILGGTSPHLYT
jgi:ABC-type molybdate transport system substrate-binding protein